MEPHYINSNWGEQRIVRFTESVVEEATLQWLSELGYSILHGPDIAPEGIAQERENYAQVVLIERLTEKLRQLNPDIPANALADATKKLLAPVSQSLIVNNRAFHKMLVEGVSVEFAQKDGTLKGAQIKVVDFANPENNEFLAINQFTVKEKKERRPDVVLFLNGLPIAVIELKNTADPEATIWKAFDQLQTYKLQIPSLFQTNTLLVISDGTNARLGSLTSDKERFLPWPQVSHN
jgi:type I restriction enzyme, R subunit